MSQGVGEEGLGRRIVNAQGGPIERMDSVSPVG